MLDESRFNEAVLGIQLVRLEDDSHSRHRMFPQHHHGNSGGNLHGGVTLSLADVSMFSALYVLRGIDAGRSVTIDLQAQFIGAGDVSKPLDACVELLRETRKMAFLRGIIEQDGELVASYSGTARKPSAPRP